MKSNSPTAREKGKKPAQKRSARWQIFFLTKHPLFVISGLLVLGGSISWAWLMSRPSIEPRQVRAAAAEKRQPVPGPLYRLLDGLPVDDQAAVHPQPVAIMIENLPSVRPQSGMSGASVVYEALAEGGATRFMAVYPGAGSSSLSKIGPVRSARSYYLEWASEYGPLYGHAGGSPDALQAILDFHMKDLNGIGREAKYFWRDRGISAPHNLFTSNELLTRALSDTNLVKGRPTFRAWSFKDEASLAERPPSGQFVRVQFSGYAFAAEWRYDQATNMYLRFNAGQIHTDALTGEQLRAKNVIVQVLPPILGVGALGRLTLDVHGSGKAFIFRDGKEIIGMWQKPDRLSRTVFFDEAGNEVQINRGATWIEVVPETQTVEAGTE